MVIGCPDMTQLLGKYEFSDSFLDHSEVFSHPRVEEHFVTSPCLELEKNIKLDGGGFGELSWNPITISRQDTMMTCNKSSHPR